MTSSYFSDLDEKESNAVKHESSEKPKGSYFSDLKEEPSRLRSLSSAFPKGLIRGAGKFSPLPSVGGIPDKLKERLLEEFLPTQKGKSPEEILEFAGENAPIALSGEGGLAKKGLQALTGGLAKKGAKELDMPEWAQELSGGAGMVGPGAVRGVLSKVLKPASKQQAVFSFLKSKGMSEDQITPIIQNKKKLDWLSKGAFKYEREAPFIKGMEEKMGDIYGGIREQGKKFGAIEGKALKEFEDDFFKTLDGLPDLHKDLIKKPVENLMSKPITYDSLLDFKVAVNHYIKDVKGGKAVVGALKGPTKRAQAKMAPELFQEQEMADKAYAGMKSFTKKMTKKEWEGITKLGNAGKIIIGAVLLNPAMMGIGVKAAAVTGASKFALRKMLTSPRLQNMHLKIQEAIQANKIPQALKIAEMMKKSLETEGSVAEEDQE